MVGKVPYGMGAELFRADSFSPRSPLWFFLLTKSEFLLRSLTHKTVGREPNTGAVNRFTGITAYLARSNVQRGSDYRSRQRIQNDIHCMCTNRIGFCTGTARQCSC